MWIKMNHCHCVVALCLVASCFLAAGCWVTRNWKDYRPITEVGLRKGIRSYTGYFYPRFNGEHVLSLHIKQNSQWETLVGLRFTGEIKLFHAGQETTIPFDEVIDRMILPRMYFKVHLKTFEAKAIKRSQDYGRFDVTIEGNIDDFLDREPDSHLSISFCDAE